jgi:hypothetical protein
MIGRPGGIEYVHEPLERNVGVVEGREVGATSAGEQFGEAGLWLDLRAENEGSDEHSDEIVECCVPSAGDRGADGDVLGAAQAREEHGQSGVHHHEQSRLVFGSNRRQASCDIGRNGERCDAAAHRLTGGAWSVERHR